MNSAAENFDTEVGRAEQPNTDTTSLGGAQQAVQYNFTQSIPDGFEFDQAESDKFVNVIKDMGLSNEQANAIAKYGFEWGQGIVDAVAAQRAEEVKEWGASMQQELGADYNKSIARAGAAIERIERAVPNFRQFLNETGVGNRVEMAKVLCMMADMIESDPGKGVNSTAAKGSIESFYGY